MSKTKILGACFNSLFFIMLIGCGDKELGPPDAPIEEPSELVDSDNDTILDINDAFPFDATEWLDSDGDKIGNNADTDDDNDTVLDINDDFPLDATESRDTDGDKIGNNTDTDDDNDTILDINDAFPLDPTESLDSDGDKIGNNADTDNDNDLWLDDDEIRRGTDPLVSNLRDISYQISEDFKQITADDTAPVTDVIFDQVSPKRSDVSTLTWLSYSGSPLYDRDDGEGIFHDMQLKFEVSGNICPSYVLSMAYSRSSSRGTRTLSISRVEDGLSIQDVINIGNVSSTTTLTKDVVSHSSATDTLQIDGQKLMLRSIGISASCQLYDSDLDGLVDQYEVLLKTDPLKMDTDGDGLNDADELIAGFDPTNSTDGLADSDADGMTNAYELNHQLNYLFNDAQDDLDLDGISNIDEFQFGLNANNPADAQQDDDNDGIKNIHEINAGLNPHDASDYDASLLDNDHDGRTDGAELTAGTDPNISNRIWETQTITEDFSQLDSEDNLVITDVQFNQITPKSSQYLRLNWQSYTRKPGLRIDIDNGKALYGDIAVEFELALGQCRNPEIQLAYSRSSNNGAATLQLEQLAPDRLIEALSLPHEINHIIPRQLNGALHLTDASQGNIRILGNSAWLSAVSLAADCALFDSDSDGLSDEFETLYGTNISNSDSDGDGLSDLVEITHHLNPLDNRDGALIDTDYDGLANGVEIDNGLDVFNDKDGALADTDGDGINNADEIAQGLNPKDASDANSLDTDNDGVLNENDAFPNDRTETIDTDGDGIGNNADLDDDNDLLHDNEDPQPLIAFDPKNISENNNNSQRLLFYNLQEDFNDIDADDNADANHALFEQLSVKKSHHAQLSLAAFAGSPIYDADSGSGIFNSHTLTFTFSNMHCDDYQLGLTYLRSSSRGERYIKVTRSDDGLIIQPRINIASVSRAKTAWYTLDKTNDADQTFVISSSRMLLRAFTVRAACYETDTDGDGLVDKDEQSLTTNPNIVDTDNDGINDGTESDFGLNPLDPNDGNTADSDEDGISNIDEIANGSNPYGYAPSVNNLSISANPQQDTTLTAQYNYYDEDFSQEHNSLTEWFIGDNIVYQPDYTPSSDDVGKTIKLCITPRANIGLPLQGRQVCTDTYTIQASIADWDGTGPITLQGRHDGHGVDVVILGDGWAADEMDEFKAVILNVQKKYFSYDTIKVHKSAWNVHVVGTPSNESGLTTGRGESRVDVDSYYSSCGGCGGLARVVTTSTGLANSVASGNFPQHDTIFMLVNSGRYGGVAAGNVATSTVTTTNLGVLIHEAAHTFAGLADEYSYGGSGVLTTEPNRANITINNDINSVKWKHWVEPTAHLGNGAVGLFEGAHYRPAGVWRPTKSSLMSSLGPFYAVNAEAWALRVYARISPVFSVSPDNQSIYVHDKNILPTFSLNSVFSHGIQSIKWYVDGELIDDSGLHEIQLSSYKTGDYQVKAVVSDASGLILKDSYNRSRQEVIWQVTAK